MTQTKIVMMPKSQLHGLYAIADCQLLGKNFLAAIESCLRGGCRLIQLRDKSENSLLKEEKAISAKALCEQYDASLIINDNAELAQKVSAAGVHLGKNDLSLTDARKLLGDNAIIGVSCYNQIQLALEAEKLGASYIAFGSVFPSPTKPEAVHAPIKLITLAKQTLELPICAIGGITSDNAQAVVDAGADMLAVISNIFSRSNIEQNTQQLIGIINNSNS